MNLLSHFSTILYLKHLDLSSPLAPLPGELEMCVYRLLCMKFNSKELLFEQFFNIISNFLQHLTLKRAYFLISTYNSIVHDHLCDTRLPAFETVSFFSLIKRAIPSTHTIRWSEVCIHSLYFNDIECCSFTSTMHVFSFILFALLFIMFLGIFGHCLICHVFHAKLVMSADVNFVLVTALYSNYFWTWKNFVDTILILH